MALIKHRPRIRLLTAPQLFPGAPFEVSVLLTARRPTPIGFVDIDLEGVEERRVGRGQYQVTHSRQICRSRARVSDAGELSVGTNAFRARFQLANSVPPTYAGVHIRVVYLMRVHVSIPWWPDARASFELNVGHDKSPPPPTPKPLLFSSRPEGPSGNEAHVEGSLSADVVAAGGVASGAAALSNVDYARYVGLRLALIGIEHIAVSGRTTTVEAHRYELHLPVERPTEGQQREFQMRLPHHVPATFHCPNWQLTWQFECKAEIKWGQDLVLRVPITVLPLEFQDRVSTPRRAPPTVGSERVQAIWREVAHAHGLRFDGRRIHGSTAGSELTIEREHRGRRGVYLIGRLRFDDLHLMIHIEPERGILRKQRGGVQLGTRRWDRDHVVRCRDATQLQAVSEHLRPGLLHFKAVRMTDDSLVAELHNAGVSKSRLEGFTGALLSAAHAVAQAREAIPPPAAMTDLAPAWNELASALFGTLDHAHMAITGTVRGVTVYVRTDWSPTGEPLQTVLRADAPMTIDSAHQGQYVGAEVTDAGVPGLPTADRMTIATLVGDTPDGDGWRWTRGAWLVDVAADSLTVTLPAPVTDTDALLHRIRSMVEWVRQASDAAGPYR